MNALSYMCHGKTTSKYDSADSGEIMYALKHVPVCPDGLS